MTAATPAEMAPAYEGICEELGWDVDTAKLEALQKANQQRLEQLDATIKDAEANLGDVEVREARAAKADYLCKIGGSFHLALAFIQTRRDKCSRRTLQSSSCVQPFAIGRFVCCCPCTPSTSLATRQTMHLGIHRGIS